MIPLFLPPALLARSDAGARLGDARFADSGVTREPVGSSCTIWTGGGSSSGRCTTVSACEGAPFSIVVWSGTSPSTMSASSK
ncbi:MAG: hypothetical protein R3F59_27275 [Myxococcota bacterium]